ncbi:unnamed protein product [Protopolystoma xenopodis]|uniref:Uncharacterized protein n=1 Tax=Protopolystoma xenopodis TaxID=117903 RepID=A0A3S4ZG42_9PLAT|nr:unnamed protein product [Protopolystoma xenopodis]
MSGILRPRPRSFEDPARHRGTNYIKSSSTEPSSTPCRRHSAGDLEHMAYLDPLRQRISCRSQGSAKNTTSTSASAFSQLSSLQAEPCSHCLLGFGKIPPSPQRESNRLRPLHYSAGAASTLFTADEAPGSNHRGIVVVVRRQPGQICRYHRPSWLGQDSHTEATSRIADSIKTKIKPGSHSHIVQRPSIVSIASGTNTIEFAGPLIDKKASDVSFPTMPIKRLDATIIPAVSNVISHTTTVYEWLTIRHYNW